jgi:UDP-3-O-[3-hydroxymyristoyl] glucosamine N-acyltransferase
MMKLIRLAEQVEGELTGDGSLEIRSVASLSDAGREDLSFLTDLRYVSLLSTSSAGAILVGRDFEGASNATLVVVDDVSEALEKVLELFAPEEERPRPGVDATVMVSETARLGKDVAIGPYVQIGAGVEIAEGSVIGPGCVIGRNVRIGQNCRLIANVVIQQGCLLGDRVVINANTTIGADGFGYRLVQGRHRKITHIGTVQIQDDVEIGANTCIDRAKMGKTLIGRGTKIDNLVQIAHNVQVGEHCILAGQSGFGGSAQLGSYVVLGAQSGVADHIKVGDGVMAGGRAGITKHTPAGQTVAGFPAREFHQYFRDLAQIKKIGKLEKELKQLKEQLKNSGKTKDHS